MEVTKIRRKFSDQLLSLVASKDSALFCSQLQNPVVILSKRQLTKSELQTLSLGFSMSWPQKTNKLALQTELEHLYSKIEKSCSLDAVELDNIRTKIKTFFNLVKNNKLKINQQIKKHLKNLLNLGKDKQICVSKFDKGSGVCILDKDT